MLLSRILVIVLLLILIQDVTGVEVESSGEGSTTGSGQSTFSNDSNCSFHHELANLTSNGLITIMTDVMLLSIVPLVGLENILIIGHDNPTVNCDNTGGIHFDNCHNCTTTGITWEKCGTKNDNMPVMKLYNSSNIIIQNCSFQHSITQAIALSEMLGNVTISGCKFVSNNHSEGNGTAIHYSSKPKHHSKFLLSISNCNFSHNGASINTSIVYISPSSNKSMEQVYLTNSVFLNNQGTPVYVSHQNVVTSGIIVFDGNEVNNGGGIFITNQSSVVFENSEIKFINNKALHDGGALYVQNSDVIFKNNSIVIINSNQARYGGGLYIVDNCDITFDENSTVTIYNNQAYDDGGALGIENNCDVTFEGNSIVTIYNNQATFGGGLVILENSNITFEGNSTVTINNNQAIYGGGLDIVDNCYVTFDGNSRVTINNNQATIFGGALLIRDNSDVTFKGNSTVTFNNNQATYSGGALLIILNSRSDITFKGNSTVTFNNNQATNGGAIWSNSHVACEGNTALTFENNNGVLNGGALHSHNSSITLKHNSTVVFTNNSAGNGGAFFIRASTLLVSEHSNVTFDKNTARQDGGAIYFDNQINARFKNSSTVTLISNTASDHGGAIYSKITQITKHFDISELNFSDNTAGIAGNLLYIDVSKSCDSSCLTDRIIGISNETLYQGSNVATSPKMLKLYDTVKCISNDSVECEKYYIENIMLGQEIAIHPCLLDYYNKPAAVIRFRFVGENHQNYSVHGSEYTSISCNHTIEGISIVGNKTISSLPLNYSILLTTIYHSVRKVISVNLTVEISPCHPGFQYHSKSQRCECYNNSGIVSCSGSISTIQRGYWFGHVTGIPTVTFCPINYCNFTCCKTTNGYYHLSPVRANQCRLHRTGRACGNCDKGYTLPYYSSECVNIDTCTSVSTFVVVILTVLYWIAIVIAVFVMMHYRISIGYLYAITYYYSIVDALLSENVDYLQGGLYIFINIMYSIAELTPQFLGKLCLVKNISGIDQQFIHYIHPLAVSLILVIITLVARCSHRVSFLISRGIIRVICYLLLLSYTSVTTTSLLLLKYSTFVKVDKVYSSLSPEIEYFRGRHLAYGMIALLCTIVIVVGLPLLLLLEPLLNHKINFTKIKPLLDQFQGCYKDKFRWFAAYYMICRLVVITITIIFSTNDFTAQYLLITVCAAVVLIHMMVKPYNTTVLNVLDAVMLLLLVLTTVLLLVDFTESNLPIQVTLILLILPLILVGVVYLLAYKNAIKAFFVKVFNKVDNHESNANNSNEMSTRNFDVIVDESMRKNATICSV